MPYVTDTHSLIWHLTNDPKLSKRARQIFINTDNLQESIIIPCIVLFELSYLVEKNKISVSFDDLVETIGKSRNYRIEPLCRPIIEQSRKIPRKSVADPWDRIIAATSRHLDYPLLTRDRKLSGIGIKIIES